VKSGGIDLENVRAWRGGPDWVLMLSPCEGVSHREVFNAALASSVMDEDRIPASVMAEYADLIGENFRISTLTTPTVGTVGVSVHSSYWDEVALCFSDEQIRAATGSSFNFYRNRSTTRLLSFTRELNSLVEEISRSAAIRAAVFNDETRPYPNPPNGRFLVLRDILDLGDDIYEPIGTFHGALPL